MNLNKTLEPNFWKNEKLIPEIRERFLKIAESFYSASEVSLPIKDLIFTGSVASYDYNENSDIDLHLIFDFKQINQDELLVRNYLLTKVAQWNNIHNIIIKNREVELYTEDIYDKNISNGIYSVLNNNWIKHPEFHEVTFNEFKVNRIASQIAEKVNYLKTQFDLDNSIADQINTKVKNIKKNLRIIRKKSLDNYGVYGIGNLVFKKLRNEGTLKQLKNLEIKTFDIMFSESKN